MNVEFNPLQKHFLLQNKQHIGAIEEQLVWLIISAMERTEEEPVKKSDIDESFNNIDWLWAHISSQLIYFVLFQYASFPNIVTTLHDKVIHCVSCYCCTFYRNFVHL